VKGKWKKCEIPREKTLIRTGSENLSETMWTNIKKGRDLQKRVFPKRKNEGGRLGMIFYKRPISAKRTNPSKTWWQKRVGKNFLSGSTGT